MENLSSIEREVLRTREANIELKRQNRKLKNKLKTNVTFQTIVNFNTLFDVKVNNFGNETVSHLTAEEKKEILDQSIDEDIALRCIEKIHFNPNARQNSNVFMTNAKNEKLYVRKDNRWKAEHDYHRTFAEMTLNVPKHLQQILEDPGVVYVVERHKRADKIASDGLCCEVRDHVYKKLPDLTYSYTKALAEELVTSEDELVISEN